MSYAQRSPPLSQKSQETPSTVPNSQPIMQEASQSSDPGSDSNWKQDVVDLQKTLQSLERGEAVDMRALPDRLASLLERNSSITASGSGVDPGAVIGNVMRAITVACFRQDGKEIFWPWVRRELHNAIEREGQGRLLALAAIFNKMVMISDRALLRQYTPELLPVLKFALRACAHGRALAILLNALVKIAEDARALFLPFFEEFVDLIVNRALDTEAADARNAMIATLGKFGTAWSDCDQAIVAGFLKKRLAAMRDLRGKMDNESRGKFIGVFDIFKSSFRCVGAHAASSEGQRIVSDLVDLCQPGSGAPEMFPRSRILQTEVIFLLCQTPTDGTSGGATSSNVGYSNRDRDERENVAVPPALPVHGRLMDWLVELATADCFTTKDGTDLPLLLVTGHLTEIIGALASMEMVFDSVDGTAHEVFAERDDRVLLAIVSSRKKLLEKIKGNRDIQDSTLQPTVDYLRVIVKRNPEIADDVVDLSDLQASFRALSGQAAVSGKLLNAWQADGRPMALISPAWRAVAAGKDRYEVLNDVQSEILQVVAAASSSIAGEKVVKELVEAIRDAPGPMWSVSDSLSASLLAVVRARHRKGDCPFANDAVLSLAKSAIEHGEASSLLFLKSLGPWMLVTDPAKPQQTKLLFAIRKKLPALLSSANLPAAPVGLESLCPIDFSARKGMEVASKQNIIDADSIIAVLRAMTNIGVDVVNGPLAKLAAPVQTPATPQPATNGMPLTRAEIEQREKEKQERQDLLTAEQTVGMELVHGCYRVACAVIATRLKLPKDAAGETLQLLENATKGAVWATTSRLIGFMKGGPLQSMGAPHVALMLLHQLQAAAFQALDQDQNLPAFKNCASFFEQNQKVWTDWLARSAEFSVFTTSRYCGAGALMQICNQNITCEFENIGYALPLRHWHTYGHMKSPPRAEQLVQLQIYIIRMISASIRNKSAADVTGALRLWKRLIALATGTASYPNSAAHTPQRTPQHSHYGRPDMALPGMDAHRGSFGEYGKDVLYLFDDSLTNQDDPLLKCSTAFIAASDGRVEDACTSFEQVVNSLPVLQSSQTDAEKMVANPRRVLHATVARIWFDAAQATCVPEFLDRWSAFYQKSDVVSSAMQKWALANAQQLRDDRKSCQTTMQSVLGRVREDWTLPAKMGPISQNMIDSMCRLSRWDDLANVYAMDARCESREGGERFKSDLRMGRSIVSAVCAANKACAPEIMPPNDVDVPFKILPALEVIEGTYQRDVSVDPELVEKLRLPNSTMRGMDRFKHIQKLVDNRNLILARQKFDKLKIPTASDNYSTHWHVTAALLCDAEKKKAMAFSFLHKHALEQLHKSTKMPQFRSATESISATIPPKLLNLSWIENCEQEVGYSQEMYQVVSTYLRKAMNLSPELCTPGGDALAHTGILSRDMPSALSEFSSEMGNCLTTHGLNAISSRSPSLTRSGQRNPRPFEKGGLSTAFAGLLFQQNVIMFPSKAKSWTLYGDWWFTQRAIFDDDEVCASIPDDVLDTLPWSWTTIRSEVEKIGSANDPLLSDTPLASMPTHNTGFNLQTSSFEVSPASRETEAAKVLHPCVRLVVDCIRLVVRIWSKRRGQEYPDDGWLTEHCPRLMAVFKAFPQQPNMKEGICAAIGILVQKAEKWRETTHREAFEAYTVYLHRAGVQSLTSISQADPVLLKTLMRLLKLMPHVSAFDNAQHRILEGPVALWQPLAMQLVAMMRHPHVPTANLALELYKRLSQKIDPTFTIYPALATQPPVGVGKSEVLNKEWGNLALPALTKYLETVFPAEVRSAREFISHMSDIASPVEELCLRFLEHLQTAGLSQQAVNDPAGTLHGIVTKVDDLCTSFTALLHGDGCKFGPATLELMTADHGPPNGESPQAKEFLERMLPLLGEFVREQRSIVPTDALGGPPKDQKERLNQCMVKLKSLIAACSHRNKESKFTVESISPQFSDFVRTSKPKLPITTSAADSKPLELLSAHRDIGVIYTKTRPKKLTFRAVDGTVVSFLLKGRDDLHLDAVLMQIFEATTSALSSSSSGSQNSLRVRHYDVIPLAPRAGLLRWLSGAPLFGQYKTRRQKKVKDESSTTGSTAKRTHNDTAAEIWNKEVKRKLADHGVQYNKVPRKQWPVEILKKVFNHMRTKHGTPDLISRLLFKSAIHPQHAHHLNQRYAESCAVASIAGHLIGLGDRHLDNLLMDTDNGEVIHVDLSVCFDRGRRLKVPEKVPFRLSPCIEHALGPFGTEGVFKSVCSTVLSAVREHREIHQGLMNTFTHMPLAEWVQSNTLPFMGSSDSSTEKVTEACQQIIQTSDEIIHGEALATMIGYAGDFDQQSEELRKMKELMENPQLFHQRQREQADQIAAIEARKPEVVLNLTKYASEMTKRIEGISKTINHDLLPSLDHMKTTSTLLTMPMESTEWNKAMREMPDRAQRILQSRYFRFPEHCPAVSQGVFSSLGQTLQDAMVTWQELRKALELPGCDPAAVQHAILSNCPQVNMLERFQACGMVKRKSGSPFHFEMIPSQHMHNLQSIKTYFPWFSREGQLEHVERFERQVIGARNYYHIWQALNESGDLQPRELKDSSSKAQADCKHYREQCLASAGVNLQKSKDKGVVAMTAMCMHECAELLEAFQRAGSAAWPADSKSSYIHAGLVEDSIAQEDAILYFFGAVGQYKELVEVILKMELQPNMQDYKTSIQALDRLCGALVAFEMGLCGITAEGLAGPAERAPTSVNIHPSGLNDEKFCNTLENFFATLVDIRSSSSHPSTPLQHVPPADLGEPIPKAPRGQPTWAENQVQGFITELEEHLYMLEEVLAMPGGPFEVKPTAVFVQRWQEIIQEIDRNGMHHVNAISASHAHLWQALEQLRGLTFPEAPQLNRKMNAWGKGGRADDWEFVKQRLMTGLSRNVCIRNLDSSGDFKENSTDSCQPSNQSMWGKYAEAAILLAEARTVAAAFGNGPPSASASDQLLQLVQRILLPWLMPAVSSLWVLLIRTIRTHTDVSVASMGSTSPVALALHLTIDIPMSEETQMSFKIQCNRQRQYLWLKRNLALGQGVQRMIPVVMRISEAMNTLNRWCGVSTFLCAETILCNIDQNGADTAGAAEVPSLRNIRGSIPGNRLRLIFPDGRPFVLLTNLLQQHAALGETMRRAYDISAAGGAHPADLDLYQSAHEIHELLGDSAILFMGPHIVPCGKEIGPNFVYPTAYCASLVDTLHHLQVDHKNIHDDIDALKANQSNPNMSQQGMRQMTSNLVTIIKRVGRELNNVLRNHSDFIKAASSLRMLGAIDTPVGVASFLASSAHDVLMPMMQLRFCLAKYDERQKELQRRQDAHEKDKQYVDWFSKRISAKINNSVANIQALVDQAQKVVAKETIGRTDSISPSRQFTAIDLNGEDWPSLAGGSKRGQNDINDSSRGGTQNDGDGNEEEDLAQSEQEGEQSEPEEEQAKSGSSDEDVDQETGEGVCDQWRKFSNTAVRCLSKKIPGCEANAANDLANSLIAQAKDEANLATMYEGWTSWI